jgi:fibronectin-binding autotransporter adhesin
MNGSLQGIGNLNRQLAGLAAALAALLAMANPAFGAPATWVGNTDANWATDANWSGSLPTGNTPTFNVAGTSGTTLNNNLAAGTAIAGMTFSATASAYTLNGNAINLTANITHTALAAAQIINLDMNLGSGTRTVSLGSAGNNFTLNGVLSGAGAVQKINTANATLFLNGLNSFSGEFGTTGITSINTLTNAGLNCSIGTAATFQLGVGGSGQITYTGPATSTDRQVKIGSTTAGTTGTGTLLNNGSGAMTFTHATFNVAPAAGITANRTLALGGSSTATNEIQGVIQDNNTGGVGLISVSLGASSYSGGTWKLAGANTYSGVTTISYGGVLEATKLDNGGADSSIGKAGNAAANLVFSSSGGTLRYVGSANASTDRAFTFSGNSFTAIESSGAGTLSFTDSSVGLAYGGNGRALTLGGTNTGTNTFGKIHADGGGGTKSSLVKSGAGRWILSVANSYTGNTTVNDGALEAADGTGLPSGSGILQLRGGVFQSSGTFTRNVNATVGGGGVNWGTGSGGFAARGAPLILNLNGGTASLTWNASSFVPTGQTLIFGSATADALVDFQNGIKLAASGNNNLDRTIVVNDNPSSTQDVARISGTIWTESSNNGIVKQGAGVLQLTGTNTYNGTTTVSNGTLLVDNTTGSGTGTNTVTVTAGGYVGGDGTIGGNLVMAGGGFAAQVGKVLDVSGDLDLSAANDSLIVLGAMPTGKTLVLKYTGSLTGTFDNIPTGYTVTYDTTNKEISIGPKPPPGTVVLLR